MVTFSFWTLAKVFAVAAGGAALGTALAMALTVGVIVICDIGAETEL